MKLPQNFIENKTISKSIFDSRPLTKCYAPEENSLVEKFTIKMKEKEENVEQIEKNQKDAGKVENRWKRAEKK